MTPVTHTEELTVCVAGLSYDQSKTQMALWCIMAAPLMMGNDLRSLDSDMKAILLNPEVAASTSFLQ